MPNVAELLLPAITWDPVRGYADARRGIDDALELGVGGFVLLGRPPESEVRNLTKELRQRSKIPLLVGAELERGAGQQFPGATGLPPLAAIAALEDANLVTRSAKLTAREARTIGVNWGFAPICDLDLDPAHPLTATRAIAAEPARVGTVAGAWIEACQHEGVLACAKHFPGVARTPSEGNDPSPIVDVRRNVLFDTDLVPFRQAISSRVASIMVAHVSYPSLDASHLPATLSPQILRYLLREKFAFEGVIVSDLLGDPVRFGAEDEPTVAIRALDSGCDLLLCPGDIRGVVAGLERAMQDGPLYEDRVEQSRRRRLKWAQWAAPPTDYRRVSGADVQWASQLCERAVHTIRGEPTRLGTALEVVLVDDDAEPSDEPGPSAPIAPLLETLGAAGPTVRHVPAPSSGGRTTVLVAVLGEMRTPGRRIGYRDETRRRVREACDACRAAGREVTVLQFGPPRLAGELGRESHPLVCAWTADRCMQEAAARWLLRRG